MTSNIDINAVKVNYSGPEMNNKKEAMIAEGYRCLGMVGKWKDKIKQIFSSHESIDCSIENARRF